MDLKHTTELCAAVKAGDADRAKRAIDAGDSIFSGKIWGVEKPPIVWAAMTGSSDCLRVLLDAGAEVDARGGNGETALMWAVSKGRRDCMAVLLAAGADIKACDSSGMTVAMWAAHCGANKDASLIDALVEAGADLRAKDALGRTAAALAKSGGAREMASLIKGHITAMDEAKKIARVIKTKPLGAPPTSLRM
jgi:ankyrin repeat protein